MPKIEIISNHLLFPEIAKLLAEGKTVTFKVKGNSMSPFMVNMRDHVTLSAISKEELKKKDVVLALLSNGHYVLHRIIKIEGDKLTLKGDGNIQGCERCTTADVIGIMTGVQRKGHYYKTDSRLWRLYSCLWLLLSPFRRILLAIWRRIPSR